MIEWDEVTLGDVIEVHDYRRVPLSAAERRTRQGPYPYYGAQGVIDHIDDFLFDGRYILIPEDGENLRSRKLPIAYFAEGQFWVNNHAHIVRARDHVAVDRFIQSALQASDISAFITGAAQPKLSQANLLRIPLRLPDLEGQRRIASVLDAIDDLIENNGRRIALLERMAQAIYREWFVHFRYPGHADDEVVGSVLGPIPAGWEVEELIELASIVMGQSPRSEHYNDSGDGLPFHQGVSNFGSNYPHHRLYCQIEGRQADAGDHLVSVRAPVGRINRSDQRVVIGRGLAAVRSKRSVQSLLGQQLRAVFYEEDVMGGGTIFKAITKGDLESVQIVQPPPEVGRVAEATLAPIDGLIRDLTFATRALERLRDILVPKLVTGAIDVSKLDLDALLEEPAA